MSALLSAEFRRFLARELLLVLVTAALAGIGVGAVIAAAQSRPPHQLALHDLPSWIQGVGFILLIGGLVLGASSVGAEWHAGTMTTLLAWEPRRVRVSVAKAVACILSVFVIAVGLLIVLALAMTMATAAAFGSALGFALAMIGRNTAAALGVTFGYLAIVEVLLRELRPGWQKWLLSENLGALITGHAPGVAGRSLGGAASVLLLYAGVLLLAAVASFRARDVS